MDEDDLENRLINARKISFGSIGLFLFGCFILEFEHIRSRRLLCLLGIILFASQVYIALRYGLIWAYYKYDIKNQDGDFWWQFGLYCLFILLFIGMMIFMPDSGSVK